MVENVAELVRGALRAMQCDDNKIGEFDRHSPIELAFSDTPSICVAEENGRLWLWSCLDDYQDQVLDYQGGGLLRALMIEQPWCVTGQLMLTQREGQLYLKGLVDEAHSASDADFAAALGEFFSCVKSFTALLKS